MLRVTNNVNRFLLFCTIFTTEACQTIDAARIAEYVNRPITDSPCIANGDGTCERNGETVDNTNNLCGNAYDFNLLQKHLEKMERFMYNCKKYGECGEKSN